jgi:hypothetical protein
MKTTAKHFAHFKERCLFWADKFGLDEWELRFIHEENKNALHTCAAVHRQYTASVAGVYLSPDWGKDEINDNVLDLAAKHEMAHLLIGALSTMADARYVTQDEVEHAEEALIVKLCKLL